MNIPQLALSPAGDKASCLYAVAQSLHQRLRGGGLVSRQLLKRLMIEAFGSDDADGAWSMRDAYDALEAAQVLMLAQHECPLMTAGGLTETFAKLTAFERALPTQTYRSEHQVELQQFSTPLRLAWLAALAGQAQPGDIGLEPSAGTGMLAIHMRRAGAGVILNEFDTGRADLLARIFDQAVTRHDGEHIDDLLSATPRPTLILINPPFSRSSGRGVDYHAGARHLRSALARLATAGRCVAIMPPNFSADGTAALGYTAVAEIVPPRAEITICGHPFSKHGTSIGVRLLVFDKGWMGEPQRFLADTLDDVLLIIEQIPPRLDPGQPPSGHSPLISSRPAPSPRLPPAALIVRAPSRRPVPPSRIAADHEVPEPLTYHVLDAPLPPAEPVGIYSPWRLARIAIPGAASHPDDLVESIAMASIPPPPPSHRPLLQRRSLKALSEAQLETVILAGDAFSRDLPGRFLPNSAGDRLEEQANGHIYRTGFFIGDGTGVGKGREVAACIFDRWNRGYRKAIWVSRSAALIEDARRDHTALGGLPIDIQPIDSFPPGNPITMTSGILFLTYAALRSARHDKQSRLQQIIAWAGDDFEGVLVFDEAHEMGNAAGTDSEFGSARGSEQGLAGVRLQNALPRACVLYASATGATKPENLSYASRLGLWGPGTAFADRDIFLSSIEEGGVAALEIVARDLKAVGLYTARALSFAGVEYEPLVHKLTSEQIAIYDAFADAWAIVHRHLESVLKATNIVDRISGATLNSRAKGSALSRFESSKQRFWLALLVAMKMPTLLPEIEKEIARNQVAVIQLVTTAEAILERRLAELTAEDRAHLSLEVSPLEILVEYLRHAFPVRQMAVFRTSDGVDRSEPMVDAMGEPVLSQEALAAREELIEQLCAMPAVPAALDTLIAHFGTDRVAEVTGRSRRLVVKPDGRQAIERRSAKANLVETSLFMDGFKPILVFSSAGGTGRSYHADRASKTADKRRIHFLLEPGWRADVAIQGLGRSHRTNQTFPPVFRPVVTDCKGERRAISTIARRLDSLGALTRGQRQTGGQGMFDPSDNLESDLAREALAQWYRLLHGGKLESVRLAAFQEMTGLTLVDDQGVLLERLPPIQRWLNRLLALRIAVQNAIFEEYMGLIQARADAAREARMLDVGVETIRAEKILTLSDQCLRTDPRTGAETRLLHLELHLKPRVTGWSRLMRIWANRDDIAFLRNARSGRVALAVPSWSITDEEGRVISMLALERPTGSSRVSEAELRLSHWNRIGSDQFQGLWEAECQEALTKVEIETVHVATGLLLPVWHKLPNDDVRVWRIDDGAHITILGRILHPRTLGRLQQEFGLDSSKLVLTPEEVLRGADVMGGVALPGLEGARLVRVTVNGSSRLEIRDYPPERRNWLKSCGAFSEVVAFKTRLFVPPHQALEILQKIAALR
ncbi:putative RNA methylase [Novosphingobium sp. 1748]|uniref:strawberry notch-like NTP hydrolase domain-containing protein n=1 Tax=Novosphingobium sp. 1748 TaxID=2817760 RepID=UPI00285E014C|nr:strawberry notch family protein [Novosphingobium sp. 1748]MDR6710194.1 putative RNA methylase [Novosphingobium sp. 1748]